jgi:DNA-binding LacI/PurR family transcriptional regulator
MFSEGPLGEVGLIPSEQRLASILGVSRTPIRQVLKEMEKAGRVRRAGPRGYVLDQGSLGGPIHGSLVLVSDTPEGLRPDSNMPANIHPGVTMAAASRRRTLLAIYEVKSLHDDLLQWLLRSRPAGVVLTSYVTEKPACVPVLRRLAQAGIPLVVHGDDPHLAEFDRVCSDQRTGALELARHLFSRGLRRVMRLSFGQEDEYWMKARDEGLREGLDEAKLDPDGVFLNALPSVAFNRKEVDVELLLPWTTGVLAPSVLDPSKPLEAVLAPSDDYVEVIGRACATLTGPSGRKVVVAGFDRYWDELETPSNAAFRPAVTVDTHPARVGEEMVGLLMLRIAGQLPAAPQVRLVRPEVVEL